MGLSRPRQRTAVGCAYSSGARGEGLHGQECPRGKVVYLASEAPVSRGVRRWRRHHPHTPAPTSEGMGRDSPQNELVPGCGKCLLVSEAIAISAAPKLGLPSPYPAWVGKWAQAATAFTPFHLASNGHLSGAHAETVPRPKPRPSGGGAKEENRNLFLQLHRLQIKCLELA